MQDRYDAAISERCDHLSDPSVQRKAQRLIHLTRTRIDQCVHDIQIAGKHCVHQDRIAIEDPAGIRTKADQLLHPLCILVPYGAQ